MGRAIWLMLAMLGLFLVGCGTTPAATPAPARPTAAPVPTATAAPPLPEPTLPDGATGGDMALPAPLYLLADQQLVRIDAPNRVTPVPLLDASFVIEFDVSLATSRLAYTLGQNQYTADTLMIADGDGSQPRQIAANRFGISQPRWSPDGTQLAFAEGVSADFSDTGGIYLLDVTDPAAAPTRLLANPPIDPSNPSGAEYQPVAPLAWSSRGDALLVQQGFGLAVLWRDTGAVVPLLQSPQAPLPCCDAVWTSDGQQVLVASVGNLQLGTVSPGLWQADARTGASTPLVSSDADGAYRLAQAPYPLASGRVRMLGNTTAVPPMAGGMHLPQLRMQQYQPDGSVATLREELYPVRDVRWATDGRGAAVLTGDYEQGAPFATYTLLWLDAGGMPPVPLHRYTGDPFNVSLQGAKQLLRWGQ